MAALASRPADEEELTFEEALSRLEAAVVRLESGELTLDEALATFEQGVRMARLCSRRLEQAEARLYMLLEQEGGDVSAVAVELAGVGPSALARPSGGRPVGAVAAAGGAAGAEGAAAPSGAPMAAERETAGAGAADAASAAPGEGGAGGDADTPGVRGR